DGMFDTADDQVMLLSVGRSGLDFNFEVLDGPLLPGDYRLTVTPTLTDVVGNPLDGDTDGTAGDAFARTFSVDVGDSFVVEGTGNRGFSTATELTLVADALGTGLYQTEMYGRGSTDPVNDRDYFKFSGQAGDRVAINADYLSGSGFDPYITLYASDGTYLTADDDSGPGGTAF
ncbi:DVUA0089 family protein, partial [Roseiconus lacunae]|uniref:DVUA0089 family protein n=1 Tax=Roseiconus lacunae TaxID=2605694 RepID=UPI001E4AA657